MSAGKLYKQVDLGQRAVVLENVLNDSTKPLFTYYNAAGTAISTGVAASTRRIAVRLELGTGGAPLVLTTDVTFRNPSSPAFHSDSGGRPIDASPSSR